MSLRGVRMQVVVSVAALALACAPKTTVVTQWTAPGATKDAVKKVLVLGIAKDTSVRRTYEDDFAKTLRGLGYEAIPGYLWEPDASKLDKDTVAARIKAEGVTHVLVTRLVGNKQVTTVTPPTVTTVGYAPYGPGYYGGWPTYWSAGYGAVVSPGYTTVDTVVTLETNFYDASKEKDALLWSGQSETWMDEGGVTASKIDSVIRAVVYQMRAKRVL